MTISDTLKNNLELICKLNPDNDSVYLDNNNLKQTSKRWRIKNYFFRIVNFITFSKVARNRSLDEVANYIIAEINKNYFNIITLDERNLLNNAIDKLTVIVYENDGSKKEDLNKILKKILSLPLVKNLGNGVRGLEEEVIQDENLTHPKDGYIFNYTGFPGHIDLRRPNSLAHTTGFPNVGNTCYLNSVLECLKTLPFLDKLLSLSDNPLVRSNEQEDDLCIKIRLQIFKIFEASFKNTPISSKMMKDLQELFNKLNPEIVINAMEDPRLIIEALAKIFNWGLCFETYDDLRENQYDPYGDSSLVIGVENITFAENFDKGKVPISLFPASLFVRFQVQDIPSDTTYNFRHESFTAPENINLCNHISDTTVPYKLLGLIVHPPAHYVSYLKDNEKWVCFNDSKVTSMDTLPDEAKKQILFAFYQRDDEKLTKWARTADD